MDHIHLVPQPKSIHVQSSWGMILKPLSVSDSAYFPDEMDSLNHLSHSNWVVSDDPFFIIRKTESLPPEGFVIQTLPNRLILEYADANGRRYGLDTLSQLIDLDHASYPICEIKDWPSVPVRGFMLDISRNKIPLLSTLKEVVDQCRQLRLNHLQLYVEGKSLEIQSLKDHFHEQPLLLVEYLELEDYAKKRGIDLVGNMNTFGHMTDWLADPSFSLLAECRDGFVQWGFPFPPSTLNPLHPQSQPFVQQLLEGLLPHSSSHYFNMNGDEPFELGRGFSKAACYQHGRGNVYASFMNPIIDFIHQARKRPMMWADVVFEHPEMLNSFHDVSFIDWGYEHHHPFEERAAFLKSKQKSFFLAPGTSSWNALAGRLKNALQNIQKAVVVALSSQAEGLLLTDWGDFGHLQFPSASAIALTSFSLHAYQGYLDEEMVQKLATTIFFEQATELYLIWHRLGSLVELERIYVPNGTVLFRSFQFVDLDENHPIALRQTIWKQEVRKTPLSPQSQEQLQKALLDLEYQVSTFDLQSPSLHLIQAETLQTIRLLQIALASHVYLVNQQGKESIPPILQKIEEAIHMHRICWLKRNKSSNLEKTLSRLNGLHAILSNDL